MKSLPVSEPSETIRQLRHSGRRILFTGGGKGKTTAALGMVLRAAGHGRRCLVIQFIKSDRFTGEYHALAYFPDVEIRRSGKGFVPPAEDARFASHCRAAAAGLQSAARDMASGAWDVVVLDEIANAVYRGLLEERDVIEAIESADTRTVIVLTGRYATPGLIEIADTVTEMRPVKHGLQCGFPAQAGVEF